MTSSAFPWQGDRPDLAAHSDLLLRETIHRCSNDLQLVVGLLLLNARRAENIELKEGLRDAADRVALLAKVRAAALDDDRPTLTTALRQVCEALQVQAEPRSIIVTLEIAAGCDAIDTARIAPVALAVNELATNAIKHAFTQDQRGSISICCRREDRHVIVRIDDDGLPFPDPSESERTGHGLTLVKRLVASSGGQFRAPATGSKTFEITLPAA